MAARANIEIFQCPDGHPHAGSWSFRVDGRESLYYADADKKWAVERVIRRLEVGRTRERSLHERVAIVQAAPSHDAEPGTTAARPRHTYVLDGQECPECWSTEADAKREAAIAAFMTRGKLGRLREIEQAVSTVTKTQVVADVRDGHLCVSCQKTGREIPVLVEANPDVRLADRKCAVTVHVKHRESEDAPAELHTLQCTPLRDKTQVGL